jgi:hypothetical protein
MLIHIGSLSLCVDRFASTPILLQSVQKQRHIEDLSSKTYVKVFYEDGGNGRPILSSRGGWLLSADDGGAKSYFSKL